MNFSIENFGANFTTDLFLYAGVAVVVWILFKDQILTFYKSLLDTISKTKTTNIVTDKTNTDNLASKILDPVQKIETRDNFYDLVVSWKQTRDLAVRNGCGKAVEVADQMFPFLSPSVCKEGKENE